jgi:hypothetical protein
VEQWKLENKIKHEDKDNQHGFAYLDEVLGVEMVEFHVDDYDFLPAVAKEMNFDLYGGNLSVRMPPPRSKPLIRRISRKLSTYLKRRQQSNVCFYFRGHWSILDVNRRKGTKSS